MKKYARQMFIRANARRKKPYGVHYRVLLWCTWARCVRIVQGQGRILVVEHYSTDVKMFENINTTTLAVNGPCRCRVEQYGTTVVNICK